MFKGLLGTVGRWTFDLTKHYPKLEGKVSSFIVLRGNWTLYTKDKIVIDINNRTLFPRGKYDFAADFLGDDRVSSLVN